MKKGIVLINKDIEIIFESIQNPPKPNKALLKAVEDYKKNILKDEKNNT